MAALHAALAATFIWDGGGADNNITTAQNWVGDIVPAANSDIIWAGTVRLNVNVDAGGAGRSFSFSSNAGAFIISGAATSLSSGVTNSSVNLETINIPLTLTGAQTFNASSGDLAFGGTTLANGGFLLTIDGAFNTSISNVISGTGGLTKNNTGTLTLTGVNTYTGATIINGGTIAANNASSLGATSGVTINAGTLEATATFSSNRTFTLSNAASTFQVDPGMTLTVTTAIGGTGVLNKTGTGTMVLSGNNTYSGGTVISLGTLQISANDRIANGSALTVSGGTFALQTFNETVASVTLVSGSITGTGTLTSTAAYDLRSGSVAAVLAGTAGLTKTTAGTVTLSGANTYSGGTTINGGTLAISSSANLGAAGGGVTLNAGTLEIATGFTTTRAFTLGNVASTFQVDASQTFTINTTAITGSGALNKTGSGTLVLGANNTYSGGTVVSAGTLQTSANERIANTTDLTVSGGTFNVQTFSETLRNVTLTSGSITGTGTGTVTGTTFAVQSGTASAILAGTGATLTKTTAGTVTLTGTNTFTGATSVNGGTLTLSGSTGATLGTTSSVTVNSGGTLMLGANDQIKNTAPMTLAGGTFAKGNFNEGTAAAPGVGALTLTASGSTLDFGSGTVGVLNFASFTPGAFTLTIDNWTGTIGTVGIPGSTDRLIFNSDQSANLNSFSFTGYGPGAMEFNLGSGYYEIVPVAPVPETSTWVAAALALGIVALTQRRRVTPAFRKAIARKQSPLGDRVIHG